MRSWEIHPMLVAFPIAFLLGGVVLDLYASARGRAASRRAATGLLTAGFWTGLPAAAAGLLAYFTVPAHTEAAHTMMYWHLGLALGSLALFGWVLRDRLRAAPKDIIMADGEMHRLPRRQIVVALLASALLVVAADLGGRLVFRGGAGVDPVLLAPDVREGHAHGDVPVHDHDHQPATTRR